MVTAKKEDDPEAKALEYPHLFDPYKRETIHILQDVIEFEKSPSRPVTVSETELRKAG